MERVFDPRPVVTPNPTQPSQVGWVLSGFGGSDGSVWVMGECTVGQWIVGVISFQKIYGLYGLKHHRVEISGDVTDAGRTDEQTNDK